MTSPLSPAGSHWRLQLRRELLCLVVMRCLTSCLAIWSLCQEQSHVHSLRLLVTSTPAETRHCPRLNPGGGGKVGPAPWGIHRQLHGFSTKLMINSPGSWTTLCTGMPYASSSLGFINTVCNTTRWCQEGHTACQTALCSAVASAITYSVVNSQGTDVKF